MHDPIGDPPFRYGNAGSISCTFGVPFLPEIFYKRNDHWWCERLIVF